MKSNVIPAAGLSVIAALAVSAADSPDLKNHQQRISYSLGADIGSNLKRQGLDLHAEALARGVTDALKGTLELTEAEVRQILQEARSEMLAQVEAKQRAAAGDNLRAGEVFLEKNRTEAGVKTTASGLQYKVLTEGKGRSPKAGDTVLVHYHGTLLDGSVFDSSVQRGEPMEIPVTGVIPGWVEALQLMKEGDKWRLFIPPGLAYGERAPGAGIGPNSTLIFEVELIAIQ